MEFDDPLFEVSTDKVDSEIPSPYDGVMLEILVARGRDRPGRHRAGPHRGTRRDGGPGSERHPGERRRGRRLPPHRPPRRRRAPPAAADRNGRMLSPLVRRLVAESGLDVAAITGSGEGGRIRREDVERAIAAGTGQAQAPAAAAPAASGALQRLRRPPRPLPPRPHPRPRVRAAASSAGDGRDQVVKLSRMRLAVAAGMKASQTLAASVWTSVEVDFDNVERVRQKLKDRFKAETGASLSYLPFVARATVDALRAHPTVNSSIDVDAGTMTLHPYVNLGIAVDLDQQGLVVPVVRDADGLNIRGIAKKITEMAGAARGKKLAMADMQGSTFTITNPGPFASWASAPIINQPNTGILCTDGVKRRPVAVGDTIAIHPTGIIGLVYDHRAFDGSTASLFLRDIRDALEQRDWAAEIG